ncbi:MAG: cation:proton antiporter [Alphaproteobacteria bacterium]|jgi:sodium/hydrogen antiporter|nr:sodium:proton antiporter [Rhodospirillaceae bacterium]MBT7612722.1 sodium:proton antiporter [Rhodospirillaceae bacterium]MDG2481217.1 cation:proton antiporter [Alphaproteobacteria bacterium]
MSTILLIVAVFTAAFAMVAKRMNSTMLTAPMIFIALGAVLSLLGDWPHAGAETALHVVAEVALIVLLFIDAAQIDLGALRKQHAWPQRMLLIGLPGAMLIGTAVAWLFMPDWPIFALALVAAILAPTDAALGQAVITNPAVPERARRALTVESGLNDGLALPAVLLFASLASFEMSGDDTDWLIFAAMQLTLGPLVGTAGGSLGGFVLLQAKARRLTSDTFAGIGAIALAGGIYMGADAIGGNGFIAAFVAGLCFGNVVKGRCKFVYEFTESEGQLLTWGAFFMLGLVLVPSALAHLTWATATLILISLFFVRPIAIWLSLLGSDASPTSRLFFGWFGPRGLATALFALLIVPAIDPDFAEPILALAINAVWISALLHGLSAQPGARWYAARVAAMGPCPETQTGGTSAKPLVTHHHHDLQPEDQIAP